VISSASRPRLVSKARLRFDRKTERTMVLFPEKGIELSASAAEIMRLCDGERTVGAIVERLSEQYAAERLRVEREVLEFLNAMADRCLIEDAA
jgi:pyrroloquinoline quinone biosynthesis protein D